MITILGGGVAGAALARALAVRGRRDVVVFDPRPVGGGSTGRATGGFRTQFENKLNIALSLASRPFFVERAERIRFQSVGYLCIAEDAATAEKLRQRAEVQVAAGLPITHPDPATLLPFFDMSGVIAANFCQLDGTYYPPLVLQAFIEEAREAGATFRYECEAGPRELEAEVVVVAAGSWSREVGAALGVELGVEPVERGAFLVNPRVALPKNMPLLIDAAKGWAMRERDGRLLIVPPSDPNNWEETRAWLEHYVPTAVLDEPEEHWTGFYEVTFDHHPLVGETSRPGVWADCGFSGHGVMHSPAIADCLAAMNLGETPALDIAALSPLRTQALIDSTQV